MERFFREIVGDHPNYRQDYSELHGAYMKILNEELAPHALTLALAIRELEDAHPEIATEVAVTSRRSLDHDQIFA